jgi:hypothetical protein
MDDVLRAVRRVREEYAAQFGFDIQAMHRDLTRQENESGHPLVSFPPRRVTTSRTLSPVSDEASPLDTGAAQGVDSR